MRVLPRSLVPPRWDPERIPSRAEIADALLCPYPLTLNAHVQAAQRHSIQWLSELDVDPDVIRKAEQARMAWMVAGFYPTAGLEELCIATDYLCWAFALDDLGDETSAGQRPAQLAELFAAFELVLQGKEPPRNANVATRALFDIVERLAAVTSPEHVARFHVGNSAYFGGMLWEANNRAGNWVPNESTFMTLRPAAGAVPPFFALIEPLEHIELAQADHEDPDVQELTRLAGGIVCFINDVLSYEKERSCGDVHNLAIVYEYHRGLAPGAAIAQAVSLTNAELSGFMARENSLSPLGADAEHQRERYIATLRSMIRVTRDWTLGSARYAETDVLARAG